MTSGAMPRIRFVGGGMTPFSPKVRVKLPLLPRCTRWGGGMRFADACGRLYDDAEKAAPCQPHIEIAACFPWLMRLGLAWWQGTAVAPGIDATMQRDQVVALVVRCQPPAPLRRQGCSVLSNSRAVVPFDALREHFAQNGTVPWGGGDVEKTDIFGNSCVTSVIEASQIASGCVW